MIGHSMDEPIGKRFWSERDFSELLLLIPLPLDGERKKNEKVCYSCECETISHGPWMRVILGLGANICRPITFNNRPRKLGLGTDNRSKTKTKSGVILEGLGRRVGPVEACPSPVHLLKDLIFMPEYKTRA